MGLYPRNMSYVLNKLNGYSRQKYKLSPNISESQTLTAGNTIICPLPENSIVDLDTFAWFFTLTTPAGNLPSKHIETLISKVSVECNGRMIDEGFDGYNLLWRRLADFTLGDKESIRGVLNNGIGSASVSASNVAITNQRYSVYNFMGFVGTAQPRCIDTSLLGSMRVVITLAPNAVVMKHTDGAAAGYSLGGNYFTIETITMNDGGLYANTLAQRLNDSANPIEIPFQTFSRFSPGLTSLAQTTTGTLSTESLDVLIGMYQDSNASSALVNSANAVLKSSQWFKTGSSNLTQSYFTINNNPYPTNCFEPHDAFYQTLSTLALSQDSLGASDPAMSNLTNFRDNMFCHMVKLNHNTATDERVKSGLNLRGTNATISYTTTGTEGNITPHLFAGYTSVLRVEPFKQLSVIR